MALSSPECTITRTGTLEQAKECLAGDRFDVLIFDLNLPDGSGLDLLQQVRQGG